MRRWTRFLLALAFLPLTLVLAGPAAPGVAAASWSKWESLVFKVDVSASPDATCWAGFRYDGEATIDIAPGAECIGGADVSLGQAQPGEAGNGILVWVEGVGCDGGQQLSGVLEDHPRNNTWTVAGYWPSQFLSMVVGFDCDPARVCVQLGETLDWQNQQNTSCVAVAFSVPDQVSECQYGWPELAHATMVDLENDGGYDLNAYVRWASSGFAGTAGWTFHTVYDGPGVKGAAGSNGWGAWSGLTFTQTKIGHFVGSAAADSIAVGVQVWNTQISVAQGGFDTSVGPGSTNETGKMYGLTNSAKCYFWIGPKWRETIDTRDEPWANVDEGVEDPNAVPESPLTEPVAPADEASWWLAVLALLRSIVAGIVELAVAIAGLAAAIVAGLSDLLFELFVPSPSAWGLDGLIAQAEAKPPFSVLGQLGDEASAFGAQFESAGSCGVFADFGDGMSLECNAVSNAPGLSQLYGVVQVILVGLTGWHLFMLGSRLFESGQ